MFSEITDIWFRSVCSLEQIAEAIGLSDVTYDAENYWAWMIGTLANVELDVARTHTCPAEQTDTRIFRVDNGTFDKDLISEIVARLGRVTSEPIRCGRWVYRSGDNFDLQIMEEFEPTDQE